MNEEPKYRRETILKVLTWGTIVYFLAWGYSIDKSSIFELCDAPLQVFKIELCTESPQVTNQRIERGKLAKALVNEAKSDDSTSAKLKVEAAKVDLEVYLDDEKRKDNQQRAVGLIIMALVYCIGYPILVWKVYKNVYPPALNATENDNAAEKDIITRKWAMIYAIFMSVSTFYTAFMTAYN